MKALKNAVGIIVLAAGLASVGAAVACTDAPVLDRATLSGDDWRLLSQVLRVEEADLKASLGELRYAEYPVDSPEGIVRCIYAETNMTCSNGVAVCALILYDGTRQPRVVLDAAVHEFETLATATNGWPDVALTAASSDGNVYYSVWSYRDDAYEQDSSVVKCSWAQDQCPET